jgi:amino acid permease
VKLNAFGIFSTVPLIVFAFMYQINMPLIYQELNERTYSTMNKVVIRGTVIAVMMYVMTGIFGYLTFVKNTHVLETENILDAPYGDNTAMMIGEIAQFFSVLTSYPLCVLPCKEAIEEMFWKKTSILIVDNKGQKTWGSNEKMSLLANTLVTLGLCTSAFALALFLDTLGDALTIVGSTTNPIVGFIIPIMFYWRINPEQPLLSRGKIVSLTVAILVVAISIVDLLNFFLYKD